MSCGTQAGKCALEILTADMFSEVTINNHKCHASGVNEQIWQALLCSHVIQVMVGLDFLKQCSVASAKYTYTNVSSHIQALRFGNTILRVGA